MEVRSLLGLVLLDDERVGFDVGVLADSGDLPGDFEVGGDGLDGEGVGGVRAELAGDVDERGVGGAFVDDGELVAEVLVEGGEPVGECDGGQARKPVGGDGAVVDVLYSSDSTQPVDEGFVGGVQGVVDGEVLGGAGDGADDLEGGGRGGGADADTARVGDGEAGVVTGVEVQAELVAAAGAFWR